MRAAAVAATHDVDEVLTAVRAQPAMAGAALVAGVSTKERYTFTATGDVRVAVVDYGCKRSILRRLAASGAAVDVFPHDVDADTLAEYDGVLLSPGPGDPAPLVDETRMLQDLLGRTPVLGVCLGHQLLALATGRETFKLPFGHRGANHPVLDHRTNRSSSRRRTTASRSRPATTTASRTPRSTTARSRASTTRSCARARRSSIPEAAPGPHDAASIIGGWVEELKAVA